MKIQGKKTVFKVVLPSVLLMILVAVMIFALVRDYPATPSGSSSLSSAVNLAEEYPSPEVVTALSLPEGLSVPATAKDKYFYIKKGNVWQCTYLKGVNMGLSLPTTDLVNPDIPYDTYLDWFSKIADMNCNTIKVFTIMNPDFYRALYDYNTAHTASALYLLQGLWFNENDMYNLSDAYADGGKILKSLQKASREALDIIHGNSSYTVYGKQSPAVYDKDISEYVAGFILGLEWYPDFVKATNEKNIDKTDYQGKYLMTGAATPFERFLSEAGDYLIEYETVNYAMQHPVAFLNWQSTDPLKQDNEPFPEENMVQIDTEHILPTGEYYAGLFAAIDIYPYYPEFMNYQKEYISFKDKDGALNPYRGYLNALKKCYSVPVVVAEVGLPTSRGVAHTSISGFNQGGLTEKEQGTMVLSMLKSIALEGYAGFMIFSWQDEWFKQTWNTYKYGAENAASRTPNRQSAEQSYGILAYEPGETAAASYPDGDIAEWNGLEPVFSDSDLTLYVNYDEGYLYLYGKTKSNPENAELFIALSTTGRGNTSASRYGLTFQKPADFLLDLNGKKNTRLLTDAAYDYFYYTYSVQKQVFSRTTAYEKLKSGLFNPIYQFLSNEISLPKTNKVIKPKKYESGLLVYGNANPDEPDYNSLADFCFGDNFFEVRIPWYLLNILSPTEKVRMGDLYSGLKTVKTEPFSSFYVGAGTKAKGNISMSEFSVNLSLQSAYHARLKQSYDILKDGLAEIMESYR